MHGECRQATFCDFLRATRDTDANKLNTNTRNEQHIMALCFRVSSGLLRSRATSVRLLPALRCFSDSGSHGDFAPKKKASAHDLSDPAAVQALIAEHIQAHPVLLYMKGTPSAPQCGFSQQAIRGEPARTSSSRGFMKQVS